MRKASRLILSLFFLGALLLPVRSLAKENDGEWKIRSEQQAEARSELSKTVEEQSVRMMEQTICKLLEENLAQNGINAEKIGVTAGMGENGVELYSVEITVKPEWRSRAQNVLAELQIPGRVIVESEAGNGVQTE